MAQDPGQQQPNPTEARTFLATFGHTPDALAKIPDADVVKTYTGAKTAYDKAVQEAVAKGGNGGDWRKNYVDHAKGDEKMAKQLERFASHNNVIDSYMELQRRIGAGELRSQLPKDAKPEELTKWRSENGLPEKPEGYQLNLGDGFVLGDEDKPMVEAFRKAAHEANLTPAQFNSAVGFYYDLVDTQAESREALDVKARDTAEDYFRKEWGGDYRKNKAIIEAFLEMGPPGTKDLLRGRMPDGTPIGSHPALLSFLVSRAREVIDASTILPADGAQMASAVATEIDSIKKLMADKNSDYYKGPKETRNGVTDTRLALRYRDLVGAQQRSQSRQSGKA